MRLNFRTDYSFFAIISFVAFVTPFALITVLHAASSFPVC
jgi:hypothetical protein